MAVDCAVSFGLCRVRVTRVDGNGNVIAGNNAYVTDAPLTVTVTPNIEAGNTIQTRNGCGCKIFSFKFPDTFNWWEFSFQDSQMEPELQAFMLGAPTITDGADVVSLQLEELVILASRPSGILRDTLTLDDDTDLPVIEQGQRVSDSGFAVDVAVTEEHALT